MDYLILLEYHEKTGQFHYNMVRGHHPSEEPNTFGWETIAFTEEEKARVFCNIIKCKLHRRQSLKQPPYTVEYIRKEWKHFCYVYNCIVSTIEIEPKKKEYIKSCFNEAEALARLGNGHYSYILDEKELPWAWEYDPLDFEESNF